METGIPFDVVFVIVTCNSEAFVGKCIESIYKYVSPAVHFEVVVVDNNSSDSTRKLLSELESEFNHLSVVLLDENIGFGPANNIAFQSFEAGYYVCLNQDAWLIGDSITPALEAMDLHSEVAICGLPLVFPDGAPQTYAYPFSSGRKWLLQLLGARKLATWMSKSILTAKLLKKSSLGREYLDRQRRKQLDLNHFDPVDFKNEKREVDWVCGAAMVVRKELLDSVGGFDPAMFLYGEDEDLCLAAHRIQLQVVAIDTIPVVHVFGWGENRFDEKIADLKYASLRYFVLKNIERSFDRRLMLFLLPYYVYGRKWISRIVFPGRRLCRKA